MFVTGSLIAFGGVSACTSTDTVNRSAPLYTQMTETDVELADQTLQRTLEEKQSGIGLGWKNESSGNSGFVTPIRTYRTASGSYCREFSEVIVIGNTSESYTNTACRSEDGIWLPVPTENLEA